MTTLEARAIFDGAIAIHKQASERLLAGDVRDAAEKAWCATKRATDAMILTLTNKEPRTSGMTMEAMRKLYSYDRDIFKPLHKTYSTFQSNLHGHCFYDGNCEPADFFEEAIREVLEYINDLKAVAGQCPPGSVRLRNWNS
jgi:hypothetical protein